MINYRVAKSARRFIILTCLKLAEATNPIFNYLIYNEIFLNKTGFDVIFAGAVCYHIDFKQVFLNMNMYRKILHVTY